MALEQLSATLEQLLAAPERLLDIVTFFFVTLFQKRNRYFRYNVIVSLHFTSLHERHKTFNAGRNVK